MLRLKKLRKEKGVSQQTLAGILKVTQATISGWESEKFEVDNASLFRLADYFNVSVDYLLGRTDEPNAEKPASAKGDGQSEIYDIIESLSPDNRAKLLELARLFLDAQCKSEENG